MSRDKLERALVPFFGTVFPKEAQKEALKNLKKGGKLYLLHITDEAPTKSVRYMTGELGKESELIKNFQEARKELQERTAKKYAEKAKMDAAKKGISIELLFAVGNPTKEVIKAIEEHSIQLVVIESLREKISEIFWGDEVKYLKERAPCEVLTI